jgi:hypothetical protein
MTLTLEEVNILQSVLSAAVDDLGFEIQNSNPEIYEQARAILNRLRQEVLEHQRTCCQCGDIANLTGEREHPFASVKGWPEYASEGSYWCSDCFDRYMKEAHDCHHF